MGINWTQIGKELAVACLGLLLFGVLYNLVVEYFQRRTQRYTAELVVIGVMVIVGVSGFIIGWDRVLVVLILFVAGGAPMVLGSWIRTAKDEEAARKVAQREAQDLTQ